tara:strand:- start:73 stop:639 length:567 start_codon:yes stop_codon:yes gene_type:complete
METAIIIVLAFMLLISIIILIDIRFDIKGLNIKNQACASALDKLKKENGKLKTNNENLKITIDEQEARFNKHLKKAFDYRESNASILETKYKSALQKIIERDQKTRLLDSEILKYEKCNKQISEDLIKKNNVIEDSYTRIKNMDQEKQFAINQSKNAMKLCNEMANKFEAINSELKAIESQLLGKLNP